MPLQFAAHAVFANGAPLGAVPIVIAETGHRDLVDSELDGLRARVRAFFAGLKQRWPAAPPVLLTSLAEGAGRLVAHEAKALGIPLIVVLPMPADLYRLDFEGEDSKREFDELCACSDVYELPLVRGVTLSQIAVPGEARNQQYAQLGVFLSSHCHILLALWDGKPLQAVGGTAQVVAYHLTEQMPGYTSAVDQEQHIIADDENDLVFHLACSRARAGGAPIEGLAPLSTAWLTSDLEAPRSEALPAAYAAVFERCAEFNRDLLQNREAIVAESRPLLERPSEGPSGVAARIEALFRAADWLAVRFQRNVHRTQRATYLLALLMGLVFIVYSHLLHARLLLLLFLALFGVGFVVYVVAKRRDWHRKYLDYRALAEGLRVQYWWEMAGVNRAEETNFAHASFLQRQDVELGWIRNVMRWAQLRREPAERTPAPQVVQEVVAAWVGAPGAGGQLDYYGRQATKRTATHHHTRRLAFLALCSGIGVAILVAIIHGMISDYTRNVLLVMMGLLPLIAAVQEAYSHKRADKELIKQYRFMYRLFAAARHRIELADNVRSIRQVLRTLGDACLTEHAEWIRMHRDRPLDHGRLG